MREKIPNDGSGNAERFLKKFQREFKVIFSQKKISTERKDRLWQNIDQEINQPFISKSNYLPLGLAASLSFLLVFFTYQFLISQSDQMEDLAARADMSSVTETQLILSEDETLLLENDDSDIDYSKKGEINIDRKAKAAASSEYNTLIVPYGKKSRLTLEDGTKVWVNSGSKLIYPVSFNDKERKLFVEGEAFFEVAKDEKRPFTVQSKNMDLRVLGTAFNISSYPDESTVSAVLVSGSVEIHTGKKAIFKGKGHMLKPNDRAVFGPATGEVKIKPVDTEYYVAWKDGYIKLRNTNLKTISKRLEKFYNVKIELVDPSINEETFTGKLDLKQDLEEVLDILTATTSLKYSKNERRYLLMK
ncbi:FecR family protein [Litoribacter ruber]|uniref:FecR family protein n=1 Tax=Litoribacter ruber TaxID=702568 RepID=UPI001BDB6069|nr:FecR domain-containing protein [Litoribacter ruber]